jgi:hypothetical protein
MTTTKWNLVIIKDIKAIVKHKLKRNQKNTTVDHNITSYNKKICTREGTFRPDVGTVSCQGKFFSPGCRPQCLGPLGPLPCRLLHSWVQDFGNIVLHAKSSLSIDGSREGEDCRLGFAATPAESVRFCEGKGAVVVLGEEKARAARKRG